ncbi:restriction endonuclease [Patescibacteria group bacterium]|nr:restriction endonuclease [Patescibacteria group bacterium]
MSTIRALDLDLLNDLFEMHGGYVLDFTDRSFGDFFRSELKIDIDRPQYAEGGSSKAKRLRHFVQKADNPVVVQLLISLWEYRETKRRRARRDELVPDAESEFWSLIVKLGGKRPSDAPPPASASSSTEPDKAVLLQLSQEWIDLSKLDPQPRGYAFERFLKSLFSAYKLDPRNSFRNVGEQIDGSFVLNSSTYLVEARYRNAPADAAALHTFHGKIEQKADWSRGLFISIAGFSPDSFTAFGRAQKKLICMDGLDLYEMLSRGLRFDEVIERKVRRAAEDGDLHVSVRDLF